LTSRITHIALTVSVLILFLSGCTGLRGVPEGKHLFTGSTIALDSSQFLLHAKATKTELHELIPVKSNRKFFWMRPLLCLHNMIPEPKNEKGFWHWMKYKLGDPPAVLEEINLPNLTTMMVNRLENRGHFLAKATYKVDSVKRTARVTFNISPGKPYRLKSIKYPEAGGGIAGEIHNLQNESILKMGNIYSLVDFENARLHIDSVLKEKGYFYFNADYLIFTADTTVGDKEVNVWLNLKPEIPKEASKEFKFKDIYVVDDYSLTDYHSDTTQVSNYYYVSEKHMFKPEIILHSVFLEKDSLYSRQNHLNTIRHLMGIGVYKFAIARFTTEDSPGGSLPEGQAVMNANIFLTPFKKISLGAEMSAAVKTTGFAGPGLKLSYKNKNALGGAELFAVTLGGNFETQLRGDTKGQTSYKVTLDASLTLPKSVPFKLGRKDYKSTFPKTIITTGIGLYSRVSLYDLHSLNLSLGYSWRQGERISHLLRPIDIIYTDLANTTADFQAYLNENPTVRRSFEEQFVIGASYVFTYSDFGHHLKHNFYLSEGIDLSGNLVNGIATLAGAPLTAGEQHELLGLPFSQFIKLRNEERYFYNISKADQLGFRLIAGAGIPYKNSSTMPYSKQFFAGGPSNIRAFLSRSVGPGTYLLPDSVKEISIDQAGDITVESSIEYRFNIIKSFKGALFTDAGNIWLVNEDTSRAGGKFNVNTFYKELAVGSGVGFRFDFTFIILRFDAAFPVRKPWLPEGERWVVNQIAFGNPSWRSENIVWNIAIGYPF
jgi:outer membrane protein assembly factor BamA